MTKSIQSILFAVCTAIIGFAFAMITPALAYVQMPSQNGDSTHVSNTNNADVSNDVFVGAFTGANDADGGEGDDGGDGGDASATGDGDSYAQGGQGGTGGGGGAGGGIYTGNALSIGTVANDVNSNDTEVTGCGCNQATNTNPVLSWFRRGSHTHVSNVNNGTVGTALSVLAKTGRNNADGGDGDDGGDGGNASANAGNNFFWWLPEDDSSTAVGGNGGQGGAGAVGGLIVTGASQSDGLVTNVVNRNVTRVTR